MKNKKLEKAIIIAAAVFVLAAVWFIFRGNSNSSRNDSLMREMPVADSASGELNHGISLIDTFDNSVDTIENIAVVFTKFYREAHGKVTFALLDGNEILYYETMDAEEIPEQHRIFFTPEKPLENMAGKKLKMIIYAYCEDYEGVGLMMKTEDVRGSQIKYGDEEFDGTVCFSINISKDQ
ncbi:MAG: hypothetical protein II529_01255 [Erysipelotrichaceae bacterium]|nr:hypothetical protein [Erysipelotrichaceae bacterium]